MGKKLNDSELAERDAHTSAETLRKRAYRAKKKAETAGAPAAARPRLASVVVLPERQQTPSPGKELDPAALAIFEGIKLQFESAGRWNVSLAPLLRTYANVSSAIDSRGVENVSPGLLAAQARAATILDLPTLPAARQALKNRDSRFFVGW